MTAETFAAPAGGGTGRLRRSAPLGRVDHVLLLGCIVLAAIFRLTDLQQPLVDAFSWRQASTAMMADNFRTGGWNIFFPEVSWAGPGPGYQGREFQVVSYITALLHAAFGWHDWLGRLVAVAFGVWTVFALHRLTDAIWGTVQAHFVGLAYAIMPGAILIDRAFLPDPAMLALVTTALWLFVRYVQEERAGFLFASGFFLALGILAKLPGIAAGLPVACLSITPLLRGQVRQATPIIGVGIVSLALVATYYAWAVHLGTSYPPYHVAGSGYIWDEGVRRFVSARFFAGRAWDHFSLWYLSWPLILLVLVGLLHPPPPSQLGEERALVWLFHVWLAAASLVYLMGALEIVNNPWNFHVFSAPLAAFAGRGLFLIATAGSGRVSQPWSPIRLLVIVGFAVYLGTQPALRVMKEPYAQEGLLLGLRLEQLSAPGDLVIAVSPAVGDPVAIYYSRRRGWVFPPGGGTANWARFVEGPQALEQLEELRREGADWFGVARNARDSQGRSFTDHHLEILTYLDATAERVVDDEHMIIFRLSD